MLDHYGSIDLSTRRDRGSGRHSRRDFRGVVDHDPVRVPGADAPLLFIKTNHPSHALIINRIVFIITFYYPSCRFFILVSDRALNSNLGDLLFRIREDAFVRHRRSPRNDQVSRAVVPRHEIIITFGKRGTDVVYIEDSGAILARTYNRSIQRPLLYI